MPETTVAPSAPSTPAPAAAPAAGGGSTAPAWAGGDVGSFLSSVTGNAPATAPAPATQPVASAAPPAEAPPPPAAPVEAAPVSPEAPATDAKPADPANPDPTASAPVIPKPEPLLAGRFKTADELVQAYTASGQEGRRIRGELDQAQGQLKKLNAEMETLRLEKEMGPEVAEPTPEELAAWDTARVAKFYANKTERKFLKERLERESKARAEDSKRESDARQGKILSTMGFMERAPEKFPRLVELVPTMHEILGMAPALVGQEGAPYVTYLAAYGHEALQRDLASKDATVKAAATAKLKAAAGVPAAGGTGGNGAPAPEPPKPASAGPEKGSDAEHVANLLAAHTGHRPILPID